MFTLVLEQSWSFSYPMPERYMSQTKSYVCSWVNNAVASVQLFEIRRRLYSKLPCDDACRQGGTKQLRVPKVVHFFLIYHPCKDFLQKSWGAKATHPQTRCRTYFLPHCQPPYLGINTQWIWISMKIFIEYVTTQMPMKWRSPVFACTIQCT